MRSSAAGLLLLFVAVLELMTEGVLLCIKGLG